MLVVLVLLGVVRWVSGYECTDGCTISDSFLTDNYCDCSDCGDEEFWDCDSCGCPTFCGGYYPCAADNQSLNSNSTEGFVCDDGCAILDSYVDDNWCDCSNCEEETNWDCHTCGDCPLECGGFVQCTGGGGDDNTTTPGFFTCDDGCEIPDIYKGDDWCDCTQCEDEVDWSCETCPGGCPTVCGAYVMCQGQVVSNNTNHTSPIFTCNDGCAVVGEFHDDGFCDCSQCEDETIWTCESCGGCPIVCGGYVMCEDHVISNHTNQTLPIFTCDDGCVVVGEYHDDGWCDCSQCEDETLWTCETCGGCPVSCGGYVMCDSGGGGDDFICDDGCAVSVHYVNDDWCDCSNCEEEDYWDCHTCGDCPLFCGGYAKCGSFPNDTSIVNATEFGVYTCDDGCSISALYVNDDWCDCSNCEDEHEWTCGTCGACPWTCGGYVICGGDTTNTSTTFTCNDGCVISEMFYNDDWCDCSVCEDETNWDCHTCGECPDSCGSYVQCFDEPPVNNATDMNNTAFKCDNGCYIDPWYFNDNWCDCTECEDEQFWDCDTCGGCPEYCGAYVACAGVPQTTADVRTTRPNDFKCHDGCVVPLLYHNDDFCDCSECEDELNWNCGSCSGGCPLDCGSYGKCDGEPPMTECPDNCAIAEARVNDGHCDCSDCADEFAYTCDSCYGGCPNECGERKNCVAHVPDNTETTDADERDAVMYVSVLLSTALSMISVIFLTI